MTEKLESDDESITNELKKSKLTTTDEIQLDQLGPLPRIDSHQNTPPLPVTESDVRVLKISKKIKGFSRKYTIEKILRWDIAKLQKKGQVVWVNIEGVTKKQLMEIGNKFNIHPLTIDDISHPDIEKVEFFEDRKYSFFNVKELHYRSGTNELIFAYVNIIVFSNIVLTFHSSDITVIEQVLNGVQTMSNDSMKAEKCLQTSDWILYAMLDSITDMFDNYVQRLVLEADALDELVLLFDTDNQSDLLRRIGIARRLLTFLRSHTRAKRDIISNITSKNNIVISSDIKVYLRDVSDSLARMEDKLSNVKDTLNNLHNTYLARVSIEQAMRANRVNGVMKTFSAVATVFMPLSFIVGLFGMNVRVPGQDVDNLGWFFSLLGLCFLIAALNIVIFKVRKWF